MKKLISLFLTVLMIASCFAVMPLSVSAGITSSGISYDYEGSLSGLSLTNVSRVEKTLGGRTSKVLELKSTSAADATIQISELHKTVQANSAGVWVFENDLFIPAEGGIKDAFSVMTGSASAWVTNDYINVKISPNKGSNIISKYPVGKWFTLKQEYDYDMKKSTVWIVVDGVEKSVATNYSMAHTAASWQTNGLQRIKITLNKGDNPTIYMDNMKYYQKSPTRNIMELSDEAEVHFFENFETGVEYSFSGTGENGALAWKRGTAGGGTINTVADPTSSNKGSVLHYKSASDSKWSSAHYVDFKTNGLFEPFATGTQIAEAEFYIPSTGKNAESTAAGEAMTFYIATTAPAQYDFQTTVASVKFGRNAGFDDSAANAIKAPLDKWFTIRFVVNYNIGRVESQIIEDGITKLIESKKISDLGATAVNYMKAAGIDKLYFGKTSSAGNTEYYVDNIKYYESDNTPANIDFSKGTSTNTVDYEVLTAGKVTYSVAQISDDSTGHGNALKLFIPAISAEDNTESCTFNVDTKLDLVNAIDGITTLKTDFFIPEVLSADESLSITPCTDDRDVVATFCSTPIGSGMQATVYMKDKDLVGNIATVEYPVGEWFTISFMYNLETNLYEYYLTEANGTETLIARFVNTGTVGQVAKNGIKRVRYQYKLPIGKALEKDKAYYIDNIKFSNATWGDIALADNGSYTASVDYSAQGEVVTNTKLMVMQYNAANELVAINIYTPTFADGNGVYKVENIAKAAGATSAKLAYWDSLSGATPLAVATN